MNLLLVSLYFPPYNAIGSIRIGKLAKYFLERGDDVRILTAAQTGPEKTLPLEVPSGRVIYTSWLDINGIPRLLAKMRRQLLDRKAQLVRSAYHTNSAHAHNGKSEHVSAFFSLASLYQNITNWPDARIGWLPFAVIGARRYIGEWTPDIIYASSPPPTSLIVGHFLARQYRVPWIAEFRDRWADDPYFFRPAWRKRLDYWLESRIVSHAAGIVTVSKPWAEAYRRSYGKPTAVVYNGFDAGDYDSTDLCLGSPGSERLTIVYTGAIYPGRRDPSPLFEALRILGDRAAGVRIIFVGTDRALIMPLAARHGIGHLIEVLPPVPHREALRIQQQADILLLMQWNHPKEQGNVPGKLFEYLGARRPILGLGLDEGVPANLIRQYEVGFFANDPTEIAARIDSWCEEKLRVGYVARLSDARLPEFSRENQFSKLDQFLAQFTGETKRK